MSNGNEAPHLHAVEDRPPSIPPPDPLIGRTLDGRYRIEAVLGEGGMGLVYRARHVVLQKLLAIKVLKPEVSRDTEVLTRFQQEAQSASGIGNQHIIDISDFGTLPDNSTYFVMEFLDGQSLTSAIETQSPIPPERVVHIARQICEALGSAHERSIVHRDMKPDNVYLIKRGGDVDFVKVLDFGIAKVGGSTSKLTRAGQVFGTPHYMSPEQCAGANTVDHRTDIYALGVILYEMACGKVPFDADNLMGILTKHMYEQPIPPHQLPPPVNVTPGLEAVILKCLAKSADARYQTMGEVREDLDRLQQGMTPKATVEGLDRASGGGVTRVDATGRMAVGSMMRIGTGEVPDTTPPKSSKVPLLIGAALAVLLLVGVGIAGVVAMGIGTTAAVTPPIAQPPVGPVDPTPDTTQVGAGEVAGAGQAGAAEVGTGTAAAVDTGTAETAPAMPATIQLTTEPAAAEVWQGDALLGNTPFELPRPAAGESTEISVRLAGYQTQQIRISSLTAPTGAPVRLTLVAERRSGRSGGRVRTPPASAAGAAGGSQPVQAPEPRHGLGQSEVLDPWR